MKRVLILGAVAGVLYLLSRAPGCFIMMMGGTPEHEIQISEAQGHAENIFRMMGVPMPGTVIAACKDKGRDGARHYLIKPGEGVDLKLFDSLLSREQTLSSLGKTEPGWTWSHGPTADRFRDLGCCGAQAAGGLGPGTIYRFSRLGERQTQITIFVSHADQLIYFEFLVI